MPWQASGAVTSLPERKGLNKRTLKSGHRQLETLREEPSLEEKPDFHQHLYRCFGKTTAEYFLKPQPKAVTRNPWIKRVLEDLGENVSAEELWRILREKSKLQLMSLYPQGGDTVGIRKPASEAVKSSYNGPTMRHKQHFKKVSMMYIASQMNQDQTSLLLLSKKHFPNLNNQHIQGATRQHQLQRAQLERDHTTQGIDHELEGNGQMKSSITSASNDAGFRDLSNSNNIRLLSERKKQEYRRAISKQVYMIPSSIPQYHQQRECYFPVINKQPYKS
ncbi:uncharacterized protein LOC127526238 [Erpetoichthys calabaricus]|uniref:uncharacterized protein LOC127526238 n=1 Tax=Erpetoichthys calabaricus TaxID=27687 RepID=UPI0022348A8B|nr:uncharacterized protein LOC127526238 [Erpetoichthys calabaricus]